MEMVYGGVIIMAALFLTVDSTGCITEFKISGFTGNLGYAGFSQRNSHNIIFKLTDGTDIKSDIQGPILRNQPFESEFTVANETCIRLSNITQVYLKAGGNDGWYIREIYTYCKVEGSTLYLPLNADPILYKWLDGDSHHAVLYLNHSSVLQQPARQAEPVEPVGASWHGGCITGFKISGFTGDISTHAGFDERHSHSIVFKFTDGTSNESIISGPILRNQPFEREFSAGESCIRRSNITQVYLKAGGNDGWYIREVYTYCKVEGNSLYFPLNSDPTLYKWLDGDSHNSVLYLNHSFISRSVVLAGSQELNATLTTNRLETLESDLNIRLNEIDDRLNEAAKRRDSTADNLESLKTDLDAVATIKQLETLEFNLDIRLNETDNRLSEATSRLDSTADNLELLKTDLDAVATIRQLETLESNLNETDDRISEASKRLDSTADNLELLKTDLESVATFEQLETLESNLNETDDRLSEASKKLDNTTDNLESLKSNLDAAATIEQLEMLESLLNSSLGVILDKMELLQQQMIIPGNTQIYPAASCADILNRNASSPSGYYWITSRGIPRRQYCDMTLSCGGVTGGWLRVVELDMMNSSHQCPSGLRQRTDSGKRRCAINSNSDTCSSVTFPIKSSGYSKVCGKIIAYQVGSTDGFSTYDNRNPGINGNYVDGVSLTHGNPRHHIWTFAAALHEHNSNHASSCPCTVGTNANSASRPPGFVGNDYFCDTGSADHFQVGVFYSEDPLWNGAGCESQNTCCSFNNPPWFYKQLSQPTSDNIEMRVCRDESSMNEDIPVEKIDIYVQ